VSLKRDAYDELPAEPAGGQRFRGIVKPNGWSPSGCNLNVVNATRGGRDRKAIRPKPVQMEFDRLANGLLRLFNGSSRCDAPWEIQNINCRSLRMFPRKHHYVKSESLPF